MDMETYAINPNVSWKLLKESVVAVNLDDGNYYTNNAVASKVWQYVDEKKTLGDIIQLISDEYLDADRKEIENDVKEIIQYWLSEKLLTKQ